MATMPTGRRATPVDGGRRPAVTPARRRPVHVGLEVDRRGRSARRRAAPSRRRRSRRPAAPSVSVGVELELGGDEQLVGAEVLGLEVDQPAHAVGALERADDPVEVGVGRRLADQQALHLDGQDDGDDDEQDADGDRADGVPAGLVGEVGQEHAAEGEEQADLGADVLEQHDRQLGLLGLCAASVHHAVVVALDVAWPPCTPCAARSTRGRWRTGGCRWRRRGSRPRAGGAASRCPRRGRTGRPSRTARGRRRTPRSSARGRSRTGARGRRPCGARLPPSSSSAWLPVSASEWTASASRPADAVIRKPTNLAMAMPRLAKNAYEDGLATAFGHGAQVGTRDGRVTPPMCTALGAAAPIA